MQRNYKRIICHTGLTVMPKISDGFRWFYSKLHYAPFVNSLDWNKHNQTASSAYRHRPGKLQKIGVFVVQKISVEIKSTQLWLNSDRQCTTARLFSKAVKKSGKKKTTTSLVAQTTNNNRLWLTFKPCRPSSSPDKWTPIPINEMQPQFIGILSFYQFSVHTNKTILFIEQIKTENMNASFCFPTNFWSEITEMIERIGNERVNMCHIIAIFSIGKLFTFFVDWQSFCLSIGLCVQLSKQSQHKWNKSF